MIDYTLPEELNSFIGSERIEFSATAKRAYPRKSAFLLLGFAILWSILPIIASIAFFGPLLTKGETHFKTNGVEEVATTEDMTPALIPSLLLIFFLLIGVGMMAWGISMLLKKGGIFVGTKTRMIHYKKGNIKSYDWEQFTGSIDMNLNKGDITFELRTGRMVSRKNGPDTYRADSISISGIDNVMEVEKISRERIKENDPTPSATLNQTI